jgi:phosphoesterase RecJ-like protein
MQQVLDLLKRRDSFILTTHDGSDADGLGAEIVFAHIILDRGKKARIVNTAPTAERFGFIDPRNAMEVYNRERHAEAVKGAALVILDTSDEYNIGHVRELIPMAEEVFFIDHHEPGKFDTLSGYRDHTASSTCEIVTEIAAAAEVTLSGEAAAAAYAGIVYDTGSFAYSKTTLRTFKDALSLVETGVNPYTVYHELNETSSMGALLLQKRALSTLEIRNNGRVAVQVLRKEDLAASGAHIEDAENFINAPMRCRDVLVSVLVKENLEGQVRCSLRSKGQVNVSKIAQDFGGGGHVSASGFRSSASVEETLEKVLTIINNVLVPV